MIEVLIGISFLGGLVCMLIAYYYMNEAEKEMIPSLIIKYEKLATKYKNISICFGLFFVVFVLLQIIFNS